MGFLNTCNTTKFKYVRWTINTNNVNTNLVCLFVNTHVLGQHKKHTTFVSIHNLNMKTPLVLEPTLKTRLMHCCFSGCQVERFNWSNSVNYMHHGLFTLNDIKVSGLYHGVSKYENIEVHLVIRRTNSYVELAQRVLRILQTSVFGVFSPWQTCIFLIAYKNTLSSYQRVILKMYVRILRTILITNLLFIAPFTICSTLLKACSSYYEVHF